MKSGLWHLASCRVGFVVGFMGFFYIIVPFGLETAVQLKFGLLDTFC